MLGPDASSAPPGVICAVAPTSSAPARRHDLSFSDATCVLQPGLICVIAFVPTMGFLHEGHLSLVSATAAASAGPAAIVVLICINPSQFAPTEDLATYPSDFAGDLRKLAATGVVVAVFCPPDLYFRGSS